jgi:hypothetical protein
MRERAVSSTAAYRSRSRQAKLLYRGSFFFFVLEEMVDLNAQFAAAFKILWRPGRILNS